MHDRHLHRSARLGAALVVTTAAALAQDEQPQQQDDFLKALDEELTSQGMPGEPLTTPTNFFGNTAQFKFLDLSLDGLFAAGTSTEEDDSIQELQGGGHDPNRRGFTVQNVELSMLAAIDPYFTAEAHLIYFIDAEGESQFELEEAFFTTSSLPHGLQVKGGQYFSEFGRINPQHPHQWDFLDQPIINSRLFGPDGMRGPGARVSWLSPMPWYSEFIADVHNPNGETMASFFGTDEEEAPGGHVVGDSDVHSLADMVYLGRWLQSWDLRDDVVTQLGISGAWGPNSTGSDTRTSIYGADLQVKWQPPKNDAGWPFVIWQTEVMHRSFATDFQAEDPDGIPGSGDEFTVPGDRLKDNGIYTYLLWGFQRNWITGLRYEFVTSSGTGLTPRDQDPQRDDRYRISPIVAWQPTHFSRLRLQYNYDRADHLAHDDAHSVWLGFEFLFGSHPAHKY